MNISCNPHGLRLKPHGLGLTSKDVTQVQYKAFNIDHTLMEDKITISLHSCMKYMLVKGIEKKMLI